MAPLLSIAALTVEARRAGDWRPILNGASLTVDRGEVVALIGESGAGKTTLALAALGYNRPGTRFASGSVMLDGTDMLRLSPRARRAIRGRSVAFVAQSAAAALNPAMPIGVQIGEGLLLHRLADREMARMRVDELLRLLRLPARPEFAGRYPLQTSGGQQQRVMMAMAMSCSPKLLVFDEPTTALDVTTQIEVLKAIKDAIRSQHAAAIYVSHDLAVVAQVANRIIVLRDGAIVERGPTGQILHTPKHDYTRALLAAVRVVKTDVTARPSAGVPLSPMLAAKGICATYRKRWLTRRVPLDHHVLRDVTLNIAPSETLALVGESGSGKSTLARIIAGLHPPLAGTVELDGRPLAGVSRNRDPEQLRRIQIVLQSPEQALNPRVRVGHALARAVSFYFGTTGARLRERVAELLEMVGLPVEFAAKFPGELSGGQRQRVAIARAFAARPDIILCDEFLSALDTLVAARILDLMAELQRRHGVAYLFISHDLATVATIADRVAVMYAGRIVETGRTDEIFRVPHHPYTNLLVRSVPELRADWLDGAIASRGDADQDAGRVLRDELCPFRNRCPLAIAGACDRIPPPAQELAEGHVIHCHLRPDILMSQRVPWQDSPAADAHLAASIPAA